jgi:tRNA nucleotidyltransferase (CCA-adding enzyme)
VPTIEIGTPDQDALRRDLTINALFYNINESKVEDFTKLGIKDLEQSTLRTPLEPYQTFLDDPLRVLRVIRFANRFRFSVLPDIVSAMKQEQVRRAMAEKVSFERLGQEMDLMFENKQPYKCIQDMFEYGILD